MDKLSRRKLAEYVALRAQDGRVPRAVIDEVAGYLIESRRTREAELVGRAIEDELALKGIVIADVVSAYALSDDERRDVARLFETDHVYSRETVDPAVIGGLRVKTPVGTLDATIQSKLQALQRAKL